MNQIINFKKDCMFKTMVHSINDISLTHDYKVLDDTIEGDFSVNGLYKVTASSVETEEFVFNIPFTIAISSLIDRNSIDLSIKDFDYTLEKDVLHLEMSLDMNYMEEKIDDPVLDTIDDFVNEEIENTSFDDFKEEFHNDVMLDKVSEVPIKEDITSENMNTVFNNVASNDFIKYKIYIMREEDTIESVCLKYDVTLEEIKEYNNINEVKVGDKLVIPCVYDKD